MFATSGGDRARLTSPADRGLTPTAKRTRGTPTARPRTASSGRCAASSRATPSGTTARSSGATAPDGRVCPAGRKALLRGLPVWPGSPFHLWDVLPGRGRLCISGCGAIQRGSLDRSRSPAGIRQRASSTCVKSQARNCPGAPAKATLQPRAIVQRRRFSVPRRGRAPARSSTRRTGGAPWVPLRS
jgi:hypothetical protein